MNTPHPSIVLNNLDLIWKEVKEDKEITYKYKKEIAKEILNFKSNNYFNPEEVYEIINDLINKSKNKEKPWYYQLKFW